jgi:RecA-family ATPase
MSEQFADWRERLEQEEAAAKANGQASADAAAPLPIVDMSGWDHEPVPEQEWTVLHRIPRRQVTLYSGEGGAGKSTKLLHLCAAHAAEGREWLGVLPEPGPAIFVDAEDEKRVLHWRLAAITRHYKISFADLIAGGLNLIALAGEDAVLATTSRNGKIEPTPRYSQLLELAGDIKPVTIGIASAANVFAGNENDRSQVQQFVGLLTRIAIVANGSVVLISHPSLTGINTGSGLSGSTQWHNAVRARIYERGVNPESGEQPDDDLREIEFKKNQYGPKAGKIVVRYTNGLFLPEQGTGALSTIERAAADAKAEQTFLNLLDRLNRQDRNVSHKPNANNYAPTVFTAEIEAKDAGIRKPTLEDAMRRLFQADKIHLEPYGPPSRGNQRIAHGSKPTEEQTT